MPCFCINRPSLYKVGCVDDPDEVGPENKVFVICFQDIRTLSKSTKMFMTLNNEELEFRDVSKCMRQEATSGLGAFKRPSEKAFNNNLRNYPNTGVVRASDPSFGLRWSC